MAGPTQRPDRQQAAGARSTEPSNADRQERLVAYSASVRTEHTARIGSWAAITVLVVTILVIQPWGGAAVGPPASADGPRVATARPTSSAPQPTASPTRPASEVAGICINVGAWLITSVELDRARTIRVWRAIDLATSASGPLDPTIPVTQLRTDGIFGLGWCAPTEGSHASTASASVDAWRLVSRAAQPIELVERDQTRTPSGYGALYGPEDPTARAWTAGTYVFRHTTSDGREHWFKVRIIGKGRAPAG
jgi:hypothetical protein